MFGKVAHPASYAKMQMLARTWSVVEPSGRTLGLMGTASLDLRLCNTHFGDFLVLSILSFSARVLCLGP